MRSPELCIPEGQETDPFQRPVQVLHAHPSSVLFTRTPSSPYVIYHEVIETTKRFMREITAIEQDWLVELAGHYYAFKTSTTT